jgi:hypothetical protein
MARRRGGRGGNRRCYFRNVIDVNLALLGRAGVKELDRTAVTWAR